METTHIKLQYFATEEGKMRAFAFNEKTDKSFLITVYDTKEQAERLAPIAFKNKLDKPSSEFKAFITALPHTDISKEGLVELARRAKLFTSIAYGFKQQDFQYVKIYDDGSLAAMYGWSNMGYWHDETVEFNLTDLEGSEEDLVKFSYTFKHELEERKKADEQKRKELDAQLTERRERAEFERLQKKFG